MPIVQTQAPTLERIKPINLAGRAVKVKARPKNEVNQSNGSTSSDEILRRQIWGDHIWPDHTQLPAEDGTFVKNFQEHPQSILLTDSMRPVLQALHPDEHYIIGQDSGIYWRLAKAGEPPERAAEAPDWFYVPNVPPLLDGKLRRSYVLWHEYVAPLLVIEFVSGDGSEERDKTPVKGKFWVYENVIRPPFYAIYEVQHQRVEVYHLVDGHYEVVPANERGHYPIPPLGIELGIWSGVYENAKLPWLRCWNAEGNLLLTGEERAEEQRQRAERLAAQLRALGIEPEDF